MEDVEYDEETLLLAEQFNVPLPSPRQPLGPRERAALAYCAPRGIPLSVFLGRVVYPGAPQWLPEDVQAALDWHVEQLTRCPGCGHDQSVTTGDDPPDYEVEAVLCYACDARSREAKRMQESRGDDMGAIYFRVREAEGD